MPPSHQLLHPYIEIIAKVNKPNLLSLRNLGYRIFFVSRGDLSSGTVHRTQSDQLDVHCVSIKLAVECFPSDLLGLVKVCDVKRQGKENQYGVGKLVNQVASSILLKGNQSHDYSSKTKNRRGQDQKLRNRHAMTMFAHQLDNLAPTSHRNICNPVLLTLPSLSRGRKPQPRPLPSNTEVTFPAPPQPTTHYYPPPQNLHLKTFSSRSPLDIALPKTYEGAFEVETSMRSAFVALKVILGLGLGLDSEGFAGYLVWVGWPSITQVFVTWLDGKTGLPKGLPVITATTAQEAATMKTLFTKRLSDLFGLPLAGKVFYMNKYVKQERDKQGWGYFIITGVPECTILLPCFGWIARGDWQPVPSSPGLLHIAIIKGPQIVNESSENLIQSKARRARSS
ncbi:hypothetical protein BDP27DRAFT_1453520 [Rhodocollybia butyracea]|uniref:Uncharacterized protein n=1 Tax=Rhodocollybia butyracea TaxID=206335 RepID=A0A9P5TY96_9AGAR|nr:hypothetical protein BDP27DRAFT_1453520 [Rhodocollybia butyracea]